MYVVKGEEQNCIRDIEQARAGLQQFRGLQIAMTLVVDRPFPDLRAIIQTMRSQCGFLKFLNISSERSPRDIALQESGEVGSVDPYEIFKLVEKDTDGSITSEDFYPMSMASAVEPLLNLMGYGFFFIRPSPFCAFATCLGLHALQSTLLIQTVNTDSYNSVPVSRLIDAAKFFTEMKAIMPRLQDGKIGLINAQRIKKIFNNAAKPPFRMPDVLDYLTNKSLASQTSEFIRKLQFIIVHNNMDVAALDMVRRCNCATLSVSPNASVAPCTGCV
jgi:hypothetical protein